MDKKRVVNTAGWIAKAKSVHGDRYNYSKSVYTGSKNKIAVICRTHGEYLVFSEAHLKGMNCQKCTTAKTSEKRRTKPDDFIKKAKLSHGDRYDYSNTKYFNSKTKVEVTCKRHGVFLLKPNSHLNGAGCQKCSREESIMGSNKFIEKATMKHKGRYDYSQVNYEKSAIHIKIICKKHGVFLQRPSAHLKGQGCPKCGQESRYNKANHVYVLSSHDKKISKIGISTNPNNRVKSFNQGYKDKFSLFFSINAGDFRTAAIIEAMCHKFFQAKRYDIKCHERAGRTECFEVSPDIAAKEVRRATDFINSYKWEA